MGVWERCGNLEEVVAEKKDRVAFRLIYAAYLAWEIGVKLELDKEGRTEDRRTSHL